MIAADTNVVVRFLVTGDDPRQTAWAAAIFRTEKVFLAGSVMLETAWVLRRTFGFERGQIAIALRLLAGLVNVEVESPARFARALDWLDAGLDPADALHLAATPTGASFVTFDRALAGRASRIDVTPTIREP